MKLICVNLKIFKKMNFNIKNIIDDKHQHKMNQNWLYLKTNNKYLKFKSLPNKIL